MLSITKTFTFYHEKSHITISTRMTPGKCHMVPGIYHIVPGRCHMVPGSCHMVLGMCCMVPGWCNMMLGRWDMVLWYLSPVADHCRLVCSCLFTPNLSKFGCHLIKQEAPWPWLSLSGQRQNIILWNRCAIQKAMYQRSDIGNPPGLLVDMSR